MVSVALLLGGCDKQEKVYVECNQQLGGAQCSVTHQEGDQAAEACWDFVIQCANGSGATASACHTVQPMEKAARLIPIAQMRVRGECDQATTASVVMKSVRSL